MLFTRLNILLNCLIVLLLFFCSKAQIAAQYDCSPCDPTCLDDSVGVPLMNCDCPRTSITGSCHSPHFSAFYAYCPEGTSVNLMLEICDCYNNLDPGGVQGGIQFISWHLQGGDCNNRQEVYCEGNGSFNPFGPNCQTVTRTMTGQVPGETHVLQLDGWVHDCCTYTATVQGIVDLGTPEPPEFDLDNDPLVICTGDELEVNIVNEQECVLYDWTAQDSVVDIVPKGSKATISGLMKGEASVCARVFNGCGPDSERCFDVLVEPLPKLDTIEPIITCEETADFCNYQGLFDPPLEPDPASQGWEVSFFQTESACNQDSGAIACMYPITNDPTTFYLRVSTENCFSCYPFELQSLKPIMKKIQVDPVCAPSDIRLSELIQPLDSLGYTYSSVSFHDEPRDARSGRSPLTNNTFTITDSLHLWVRVETADGCFDIQKVIIDTISNQIALEKIHQQKQFGGYIVDLDLQGPDTPYVVEWSDGAIGTKRHNLQEGFYSFTITDTNGCQSQQSFRTYTNPFGDVFSIAPSLVPNPARAGNTVTISSSDVWNYACLYKTDGGFNSDYSLTPSQSFVLPGNTPSGVYYLTLQNEFKIKTLLLMIL